MNRDEQFLTKAEVAAWLRKDIRTISNWMRRGWIPYYKIGRAVRFKESEVEAQLRKECQRHAIHIGPTETEEPDKIM